MNNIIFMQLIEVQKFTSTCALKVFKNQKNRKNKENQFGPTSTSHTQLCTERSLLMWSSAPSGYSRKAGSRETPQMCKCCIKKYWLISLNISTLCYNILPILIIDEYMAIQPAERSMLGDGPKFFAFVAEDHWCGVSFPLQPFFYICCGVARPFHKPLSQSCRAPAFSGKVYHLVVDFPLKTDHGRLMQVLPSGSISSKYFISLNSYNANRHSITSFHFVFFPASFCPKKIELTKAWRVSISLSCINGKKTL